MRTTQPGAKATQRPVLAFDTAGNTVWQARHAPFGALDEIATDTGHLTTQELRFP